MSEEEQTFVIENTFFGGRMNLDGAKKKVKIDLLFLLPPSPFLVSCTLCLNQTPGTWEGSCRPWDLHLHLFLPKVIRVLLPLVHNCFHQLVFPDTPSLETLSTIPDSSRGVGLQSEGWSSWLNRFFSSMMLELIKLFFFRALQGKRLLG